MSPREATGYLCLVVFAEPPVLDSAQRRLPIRPKCLLAGFLAPRAFALPVLAVCSFAGPSAEAPSSQQPPFPAQSQRPDQTKPLEDKTVTAAPLQQPTATEMSKKETVASASLGATVSKTMFDHTEGPYAGQNSRLSLAPLVISHAADHYGQMLLSLRENGIVPPASRPNPPELKYAY